VSAFFTAWISRLRRLALQDTFRFPYASRKKLFWFVILDGRAGQGRAGCGADIAYFK
jgi:hypothetical protein